MTTAKPADLQSEEAIIAEFWAPLAAGFAGAFGLKDDCAAITPEPGHDLVVTTDGLIAGVHFIPGEDPGAIAWKALAVNVSDLVAKGATPLAYVLSLALPAAPERGWLAAFAGGLQRAQAAFGCSLIGGDTRPYARPPQRLDHRLRDRPQGPHGAPFDRGESATPSTSPAPSAMPPWA